MATVPANDERPPMGEPGRRPSGASTGGVAESPTQGVEDALQRSSERGLDEPTAASTGDASDAAATARDREVEPHHPEEPRDEGALESFGRAIGEVVTGSDEEDIDPRRPAR